MPNLNSNSLWPQIIKVSESALACGALKPIPTHCETRKVSFNDCHVNFQVRVVENLARKSREIQDRVKQAPNTKAANKEPFNPFLPYEPDLYVGELTNHYRCLLNKFNVMDHHILMVTTQFVPQQTPLDKEDFLAAQICLQAQNGLVFYNGGPEAGASVEHKHIQMIPLTLNPLPLGSLPLERNAPFPFHNLLSSISMTKESTMNSIASALPFRHRVIATNFSDNDSIDGLKNSAENNCNNYHQMLKELSLFTDTNGMMAPHNLLMTRDCLWVVPRSKEQDHGLAVNALGFAGTLLVKNTEQLHKLDDIGCLNLLKAVAFSD